MAASTPAPDGQLEALYVSISADPREFVKGVNQVNSALDALESRLVNFGAALRKGGAEGLGEFGRAMGGIGNLLQGVAAAKMDRLDKAAPSVAKFAGAMRELAGAGQPGDMKEMSNSLGKLGGFIARLAKSDISHVNFDATTDGIKKLFTGLNSITVMPDDNASKATGLIGRLTSAMTRLDKVNLGSVNAAASAIASAMNTLNMIVVGPNATHAVNTVGKMGTAINRLNTAMANRPAQSSWQSLWSRMTGPSVPTPPAGVGGGGGGGGPRGTPSSAGWLGWFTGGAARGNIQARDAYNAFDRLENKAVRTTAAIAGVRTAMVSVGGGVAVAVYAMNAFDDALTRAMLHMGDATGGNRQGLTQGLMELSGRGRFSSTELAAGLDILGSAGMSAGMAMRGLKYAQDFAIAGNMKMEEGTKRLVDVQRGLGMNSVNVEEHFKNMKYLSDLFVGVAPRVGSTTQQIADAFGGKFVPAMNSANVSLEEGVALIGALSMQGARFRGTAGGDMGTTLLGSMGLNSDKHRQQWRNLLGEDVLKGNKTMPIADLADLVTKRLGSMGSPRRRAQMSVMGFDQSLMPAIELLIGMGPKIRELEASMKGFAGMTQEAADALRGNFTGQMKALYNSAVNTAIVFADRLAPALFFVSSAVINAAEWFAQLNPAYQQLIVFGTMAAVALYPSYVILSALAGIALAPFKMMYNLFGMMASMAFTALRAVVGFAMAIPGLIVSAISTVLTVIDMGIGAIQGLNSIVWGLMGALWEVAKGIYGAFGAIGTAMKTIGLHLTSMLIAGAILLGGILSDLAQVGRDVSKLLAGLAVQAVYALGTALLSLATAIFPVVFFLATLPFLISLIVTAVTLLTTAVGALVITVGIGFAQFAGVLASGIAALWAGFKAAVSSTFVWVSERFDGLRDQAVGVWEAFKGNAMKTLVSVGLALEKIAGFFWNFRENIKIVGKWWSANWREAIADIGKFFDKFVENTANNFMVGFRMMAAVGYELMTGLGSMLMRYFTITFAWLSSNWSNIWADAGTVFVTFIKNLSGNFMKLLPVIDAIADYLFQRSVDWMRISNSAVENNMARGKKRINYEMAILTGDVKNIMAHRPDDMVHMNEKTAALMRTRFAGPLDGMDTLKTNLIGSNGDGPSLMNLLGRVTSSNVNIGAPAMFKRMGSAIAEGMGRMSPLLKGFEPSGIWKDLYDTIEKAGGFKLPGVEKMIEAFTGPTNKLTEASGAGDALGKGGPGYTFKQMSASRFEPGGPIAERLDFQQLVVLKSIDARLQTIATANNKGDLPAPMSMPAVRSGE